MGIAKKMGSMLKQAMANKKSGLKNAKPKRRKSKFAAASLSSGVPRKRKSGLGSKVARVAKKRRTFGATKTKQSAVMQSRPAKKVGMRNPASPVTTKTAQPKRRMKRMGGMRKMSR